MKTTHIVDDGDSIRLPFHDYASSPAVNVSNPVEPSGIMHNALLGLLVRRTTDERYHGVQPSGDRLYQAVTQTAANARFWDIHCVCVQAEGCPCRDFLTWIRETFPPDDAAAAFPRKHFPDLRPAPETVDAVVRSEWGGKEAAQLVGWLGELRAALGRLQGGSCDVDRFQREVCALEERVVVADTADPSRQVALVTTSIARHSAYFAVSSGRGPQAAPEWVGDDASGAALGALVGAPGGPKGAVAGGVIGAGIFSLATATGFW